MNVYLINGFTWGKQYSWANRFGTCVNSYLFGKFCAYAEPYANTGYGLGMRIPLRVNFEVERKIKLAGNQLVNFSPTINVFPVDGDENIYLSAQMPHDKLFSGKEIVAEAHTKVGLKYNVLGYTGNQNKNVEVDLTDYLSSKGNITPPNSGQSLQIADIWSPDVSGGYFNYGCVGATFHVGAKLAMHCTGLDMMSRFPPIMGPEEGKRPINQFPSTYSPLVFNGSSFFTAFDPIYEANWTATPGLRVKAFLDVWVYSASKNFDMWLNQLAIKTPEFHFGTHDGTIRGYNINADHDKLEITSF